jgi:hypothetical protein
VWFRGAESYIIYEHRLFILYYILQLMFLLVRSPLSAMFLTDLAYNLTFHLNICPFSSPQVVGVPRFRFGPPEDMPQTSSSHSDLGQLASQGGKYLNIP